MLFASLYTGTYTVKTLRANRPQYRSKVSSLFCLPCQMITIPYVLRQTLSSVLGVHIRGAPCRLGTVFAGLIPMNCCHSQSSRHSLVLMVLLTLMEVLIRVGRCSRRCLLSLYMVSDTDCGTPWRSIYRRGFASSLRMDDG